MNILFPGQKPKEEIKSIPADPEAIDLTPKGYGGFTMAEDPNGGVKTAEDPKILEERLKANKELMVDLNAVEDVNTKDWNIVVSASIRITDAEMSMAEKKELARNVQKKLKVLRKVFDEKLQNKQTLTELLKP